MDLIIFNNMVIQRVERIFKDWLNPLEQMSNEDCVMTHEISAKQTDNQLYMLIG